MRTICIQRHAINAGKTLSKWKRNRKKKSKYHSGFDYARSFNVELVSSSNKRRYSTPEDKNKNK